MNKMLYSMKIDDDYLLDALCLFEKHRGVDDEFIQSRLIDSPIAHLNIEEISRSVADYIEREIESDGQLLSTALFALGKTYSSEYENLYLSVMKSAQKSNPLACYQAAIAIENLGNQVFFGRADSTDSEAMLSLVNDYLAANAV